MGANNIDLNVIKTPHKKVAYTPEQIQELAQCFHKENGPMYFMRNFVYVQHPTKGRVRFEPYEFQEQIVHNYNTYRNCISMVGRQCGKTTVSAAYLLWYAMFNPEVTVLVAAHKFTGTQEIMQRIRYIYENVPDYIRAGVVSYNKHSIVFDNNSRIVAQTTTANTGRGMSISLLYCDEMSAIDPPQKARDFWTSISPTLSTGGKCVITSTPNTDEDQFAEIWFGAIKTTDEYGNDSDVGRNGFRAFLADWTSVPSRDAKWERDERGKLGDDRFEREHNCKFVTFEETLINPLKLSLMKGMEPIRKSGQVRWFKNIDPVFTYVISLDPSMGTGGDNAAIEVYEMPTMVQVAEWQHNKSPIEQQLKVLKQIGQEIQAAGAKDIYWSVESNTLGEAPLVVIRENGEESFPGTMLHDPKHTAARTGRKGFLTTQPSKLEACAKLKYFIEKDKLHVNSKNLITELKTFVRTSSSFDAKNGNTDNLVSATLLFIRMAMYISTWDDGSYTSLTSNIDNDGSDGFELPMPIRLF